jgi:hypothetical protein
MLELEKGEENAMQHQGDYFTAYHNLKLARDVKGVLVTEFHTNGGPWKRIVIVATGSHESVASFSPCNF